MRRVTSWTLAVLLVLVICGALGAVQQAVTTAAARARNKNNNNNNKVHNVKESMVGGLNVTSDDLVGYAESNGYSDTSDSKLYGDISWKIKNCSTITQTDLDRAVNDAVVKTQANCRRGYY